VDECILPTKCRNPHRQHIRGKPHATGCKLFIACDSHGVSLAFWFYYKKPKNQKETDSRNWSDNIKDYMLDLVTVLSGYFSGRKYMITTDQFYGHLETALQLQKDGHFLPYPAKPIDYHIYFLIICTNLWKNKATQSILSLKIERCFA
jgi:hypothetical protein